MINFDDFDSFPLDTEEDYALFVYCLSLRVYSIGIRCVRRLLDWGLLSFIDSHCGKFECDSSTVDTINFRSDFHGTI